MYREDNRNIVSHSLIGKKDASNFLLIVFRIESGIYRHIQQADITTFQDCDPKDLRRMYLSYNTERVQLFISRIQSSGLFFANQTVPSELVLCHAL